MYPFDHDDDPRYNDLTDDVSDDFDGNEEPDYDEEEGTFWDENELGGNEEDD